MFPTLARLSKASRRPLTPKRGNKDYYKGFQLVIASLKEPLMAFKELVRLRFQVDRALERLVNMSSEERPNIA
jgi:hypothetical protein